MKRIKLPPFQEIPRLIDFDGLATSFEACVTGTERNLRLFYAEGAGGFSYDPFSEQLAYLVNNCDNAADAYFACSQKGQRQGRKPNGEAGVLFWEQYRGVATKAYTVSRKDFDISARPRGKVRVRASAVLIIDGKARLATTQPRVDFGQSDLQWSLYARFLSMVHSLSDYAAMPIDFFDISKGVSGQREPRVIRSEDLPTISDADFEAARQALIQASVNLADWVAARTAERRKEQKPVHDPRQGLLFE